jgi:hypothetical protein
MCFINPKFQKHFLLSVCTSHGTEEEFSAVLMEKLPKLLDLEVELNSDTRLRWRLEDYKLPKK